MTGTDQPRVWDLPAAEPETIGQLADRIPPDGEWHEAYGYQWKRFPDATEAARNTQTGDDHPCRSCRRPFDPDDKTADGAARYGQSEFCRRCVDRCHESTDAFHQCPVCAGATGADR